MLKIAFTGQRYKIWKQITTPFNTSNLVCRLLLLVKDTKFESKSQRLPLVQATIVHCFYWSKIQNLKANHNRHPLRWCAHVIAFTGQRYKIWKQITTVTHHQDGNHWLLLLVKDTKFESKSQPLLVAKFQGAHCFYWSKIQNLKANHNQAHRLLTHAVIAFTGQRYKIWKQITTYGIEKDITVSLLLLVKDTKFESKSQRIACTVMLMLDCFYWSKIQNLKANHNLTRARLSNTEIAFTGQRYKIWKQITTLSEMAYCLSQLLLLVKDTKFESKSQPNILSFVVFIYCFYWSKIQNLKANHNCALIALGDSNIAFTGQRYKIWKQITTSFAAPAMV